VILGLFAVAAAAIAGLVIYEPRREEPLLDLRFFRSAPFSGASLIAISALAALSGFLFLNTLYLQDVRGLSALHAGLYTLPLAAVTGLSSPLSGRIVGRRGPRLPLVVSGITIIAGGLLLTGVTPATPTGFLMAAYVILGIGFGMVNAPITTTAVAGMPLAQAGVAAAVASTSRQIGVTLGVAVVGSVVTSALHGPLRVGFTQASQVGWWILAGCGAAVLLLGLVTTGRWALGTAARTAERITSAEDRVPVGTP
jgi:MFS family permease